MTALCLDITTTGIPRATVERCMKSMLDHIDFHGRRLRWIYHLDRYPGGALEDLVSETVKQAERVAKWFDEVDITVADVNRGYMSSLFFVFRKTTTDFVFHCEDDKLWKKRVALDKVFLTEDWDWFSFYSKRLRAGGTSPAIWRRSAVDFFLQMYPQQNQYVREFSCEPWMRYCIHYLGKFRPNRDMNGLPRYAFCDVGKEVNDRFGLGDVNHLYKRLSRKLSKYDGSHSGAVGK